MNALTARFGFSVSYGGKKLTLSQGEDLRIYPTGRNERFGEQLTPRQIDLVRIATALHAADSWVRRRVAFNGLRSPKLEVEVLDPSFWSRADTLGLLKCCVDFVSGGDDWEFVFYSSKTAPHDRRRDLFARHEPNALVAVYSGGLDSSTGLALRAAAEKGRLIVPVTIRHQMQKSQLLRSHFSLLLRRQIVSKPLFSPFQAGAFIRKKHVKRQHGESFREITHRCRPILFMTVAGLVAKSYGVSEVEVFESGVGSINLPLVIGPADYRATRSTHPHFLRLLSALVSHVNASPINYILPFANKTKAEMVALLKPLELEELARSSISCILHPLKRKAGTQCGRCPACVFRRQAMYSAGIPEKSDDYETDLFSEADPENPIAREDMISVLAFHEQVANLKLLDSEIVPPFLGRYLKATNAVDSDHQIAPHAEVHRRFRREWVSLIAEARRRGFPWVSPTKSRPLVQGVAS